MHPACRVEVVPMDALVRRVLAARTAAPVMALALAVLIEGAKRW